MFFVLSRAWEKEKLLSLHEESNLRSSDSALRCSSRNRKVWGSIPHFSFVPRSWQDEKILLYFSTELKTYHLSYPIYKNTLPYYTLLLLLG